MEMISRILILSLTALSSFAQPLRNGTNFIDAEMMEENDDFMHTIKLMMKSGNNRGFKVEKKMMFEFDPAANAGGSLPATDDGMMTLTMKEDVLPSAPIMNREEGARTMQMMEVGDSMDRAFHEPPQEIFASKIVTGDVGLCKTHFQVETIDTAILMKNPDGPKEILAHPIPVLVGSCKDRYPRLTTGLEGRCVLAAQGHVAWVLVPEHRMKNFKNCVTIPGVTSLMKCPDWILLGGRCVFETEPLKAADLAQ